MTDKKNLEMIFEADGRTEIRIDASAVAELLRRAFCKGEVEFLRVQPTDNRELVDKMVETGATY